MMVCAINYFKSSVHDSDFLACELRQPTEILEGDWNGLRERPRCRLQLVHDLLDGTVWWRRHLVCLIARWL